MLDDGLSKVRQGLTTVEELLRVIRIEEVEDFQSGGRSRKLPQSTESARHG